MTASKAVLFIYLSSTHAKLSPLNLLRCSPLQQPYEVQLSNYALSCFFLSKLYEIQRS